LGDRSWRAGSGEYTYGFRAQYNRVRVCEVSCIYESNLPSIADWDLAAKMPLQQAASFPRLLRLHDLAVPPSSAIKKDQETYLASILAQNTNAAKSMAIVQNAKDADFHAFFLDSIISKSKHQELASHHWEKAVAFQEDK
jgi:hypothetical protein